MSTTIKKVLAAALVLALVAVLMLQGPVRSALLTTITRVQTLGPLGVLVFAGLYIAATVAVLPASVLTIAAGVLYGPYWAALLVLVASLSGAAMAFGLARTWLRPWVLSRYGDGLAFRTIAERTETQGARLVFLLRLSPIVPFSILNYLLGLTHVTFRGYFFASAIGMVPGILLYTHIGASLASLSDLQTGSGLGNGMSGTVYWIGLGATLLVTIVLTRWSAQALRKPAEPTL